MISESCQISSCESCQISPCFQVIIYLVGLFLRFCKIGLRFILGLVLNSDRTSEVSLSGSSALEATEDEPLSGVLRNLAAEG